MKKPIAPLLQEDIDFLKHQNTVQHGLREQAKQKYLRHLEAGELNQLENMYRRIFDPEFAIDRYCSQCGQRIQMVLDLYDALEAQEASATNPEPVPQEPAPAPRKNARKKP